MPTCASVLVILKCECCVAIFSLGFLATRAEPALRVMGKTVETLSEGQFTQVTHMIIICTFQHTFFTVEHSRTRVKTHESIEVTSNTHTYVK